MLSNSPADDAHPAIQKLFPPRNFEFSDRSNLREAYKLAFNIGSGRLFLALFYQVVLSSAFQIHRGGFSPIRPPIFRTRTVT